MVAKGIERRMDRKSPHHIGTKIFYLICQSCFVFMTLPILMFTYVDLSFKLQLKLKLKFRYLCMFSCRDIMTFFPKIFVLCVKGEHWNEPPTNQTNKVYKH